MSGNFAAFILSVLLKLRQIFSLRNPGIINFIFTVDFLQISFLSKMLLLYHVTDLFYQAQGNLFCNEYSSESVKNGFPLQIYRKVTHGRRGKIQSKFSVKCARVSQWMSGWLSGALEPYWQSPPRAAESTRQHAFVLHFNSTRVLFEKCISPLRDRHSELWSRLANVKETRTHKHG